MALPVIIIAGIAISSFLAWKLRRKKFRLAVLGARCTGKTTLIESWRGTWVEDPDRTLIPKTYDKTKLTVDGLRLTFVKLGDLSGEVNSWPQWEDRVKDSRYLLYLVDARMLAGLPMSEERTWYRVEDDAGQISSNWLKASLVHLCLLVVTHTDEDPRQAGLSAGAYHDLIARQLDPIVLRMGGDRLVRTVIGCLKDPKSAEETTSKIMKHIVGFEKELK
ncbi:hypothetical protein SAMN05421505_11391 [Sinosporangium album]|uniref:GTPase domain-containing protein n=1 Tax=Sinosporangium album TaxID=504805 RepID=A0A1G8B3E7_9ACTN|nr:GTPase domain-containing protein [Sinosporangium album]SDH27150.1 hypothetical protein SAMN05421505_11391 [Sinosporangium album]